MHVRVESVILFMALFAAVALADEPKPQATDVRGVVVEAGADWLKVRGNERAFEPSYHTVHIAPDARFSVGAGTLDWNRRELVNDPIPFSDTHGKGAVRLHYLLPEGALWLSIDMKPYTHRGQKIDPMDALNDGKPITADGSLLSGQPMAPHWPNSSDRRLVGRLTGPATLDVDGNRVKLNQGIKVAGLVNVTAEHFMQLARPYEAHVAVRAGRYDDTSDEIIATRLHLHKRWNRLATDDPTLPRVMFIGDSISYNYAGSLYHALRGKVNLHHPPQNCGKLIVGNNNMLRWLDLWDQPGHRWDIVAFNFGHWSDWRPRDWHHRYLKSILQKIKHTKPKKIIWINTAPVPGGYKPLPDDFDPAGGKPGNENHRRHKLMELCVNPYQLEEVRRHPGVYICDMHSILSNPPFIQQWYRTSRNVHLTPIGKELAGRLLARTILDVLGMHDVPLNPPIEKYMDAELIKQESQGTATVEQYRRFVTEGFRMYVIPDPAAGRAGDADEASGSAKSATVIELEDGMELRIDFAQIEAGRSPLGDPTQDFTKLHGTPLQRARMRLQQAERELVQQTAWLEVGQVPDEQVTIAEARRLLAEAQRSR